MLRINCDNLAQRLDLIALFCDEQLRVIDDVDKQNVADVELSSEEESEGMPSYFF